MKNKLLNIGKYGGIIGAIIASIFYFEGGYTDQHNDPGGETKYGITKAVAIEYGYTGAIKDLSKEVAYEIYKNKFIIKPGYSNLLDLSPALTHKLVDAGVNVGTSRSSFWFQKALNSLNRDSKDYQEIDEDGVCGKQTINAYKALVDKRGNVLACQLMIKLIDAQQATHYMNLKNLKEYTVGWVINRVGNIPLSACENYEIANIKPMD